MKKIAFLISALIIAQLSFAQIFSYGVKGGLNSSKLKFSDVKVTNIDTENNSADVTFTPSSYEMGYHFGAFARVKLLGLYVQPELIYSQTNASINIIDPDPSSLLNSTAKVKYNNFDIPLMVGMKFGPARFNLGPVATFKLSNKISEASDEIKESIGDYTSATKSATFGAQVGVGLDLLDRITIDVRYEFGLSKLGDNVQIAGQEIKTDQRQNQFIASVGLMF